MDTTWLNAVGEIAAKQGASWEYTEKGGFIKWTKGTSPTEAEIDAEIVRLEKEFSDNEYARNRASAYPSVGDQLDMLMKDMRDGTTTHKTACEIVKNKYPK